MHSRWVGFVALKHLGSEARYIDEALRDGSLECWNGGACECSVIPSHTVGFVSMRDNVVGRCDGMHRRRRNCVYPCTAVGVVCACEDDAVVESDGGCMPAVGSYTIMLA